jgi:hypothetical protein
MHPATFRLEVSTHTTRRPSAQETKIVLPSGEAASAQGESPPASLAFSRPGRRRRATQRRASTALVHQRRLGQAARAVVATEVAVKSFPLGASVTPS